MPIYMRITKNGLPVINGDATAKGHEKWIELSSAQMGQSRSMVDTNSGNTGEASASRISEIVITKALDSASTALFQQSLNGEGVTIQIDFVKPGSTTLSLMLENALISGYQVGGNRPGPTESLTLNFTKITFIDYAGPDVSHQAKVRMMALGFRPTPFGKP
jgi:type VI secretion system secreted protein Hcp